MDLIVPARSTTDKPFPCCRQEGNLGPRYYLRYPDLSYRRCKVCKRRHIEAIADAGHFGIFGSNIGGKK